MPNRIAFTQLAVDRLAPPPSGRVTVWDAHLPGFGLRVAAPRPGSKEGRKTWVAMGRVDGRAVMETIGTLAQLPKLADARDLARTALLKMKAGAKPLDERRAEKAQRAVEATAATAAACEALEGRFDAVVGRFLAESRTPPPRNKPWAPNYAAEVRRIMNHDVLPRWGDRPIRSITKHDINELLDAKASTRERRQKGTNGGAAVQANRTLTRLRRLFAWAAARDLIDTDPTRGVLARGEERSRDRVLGEDEICWFWRAAEHAPWPYRPIFQLLLLTAARNNEVAGMAWAELDLEKGVWTLPRERTKSDRQHVVHLSAAAVDILAKLPRLGPLVFPSRGGRPKTVPAWAKDRLDALMTAQKAEATGDPTAEITSFVLHDLRRTAATVMVEQLKIAPHVVDKILNHSGVISGVALIYNRAAYLDERKAALEALGRYVGALVRPDPASNVVSIRA
jgi:integrase